MLKSRLVLFASCLCLAVAVIAWAQTRKAGLWELTTTQTWQKSPFPAGMSMTPGGPQTMQVCLTQQQIDKYGGILPQKRDCQITNVNKTANGMTADMVCTGRISGKGSVESSWTDSDHANGKMHFTGALQMGPNSKPVEWTSVSSSVFKGADCGSVKPLGTPDK